MTDYDFLLDDVAWSFQAPQYATWGEFSQALHEYHAELGLEQSPELLYALDFDRAVIQFTLIEEDANGSWVECTREANLCSENEVFSEAELLFLLHNAIEGHFPADQDKQFLEGLELREQTDGCPRYELWLGS